MDLQEIMKCPYKVFWDRKPHEHRQLLMTTMRLMTNNEWEKIGVLPYFFGFFPNKSENNEIFLTASPQKKSGFSQKKKIW
jgi:hypothetical protein